MRCGSFDGVEGGDLTGGGLLDMSKISAEQGDFLSLGGIILLSIADMISPSSQGWYPSPPCRHGHQRQWIPAALYDATVDAT